MDLTRNVMPVGVLHLPGSSIGFPAGVAIALERGLADTLEAAGHVVAVVEHEAGAAVATVEHVAAEVIEQV